MPVHHTKHGGDQTDGEDIVGIGEETSSSHDDSSNVIPAERCFIDLSESESSALVGIGSAVMQVSLIGSPV